MVKTRENGYWTYTNISGNNQSVPEGLEVYAVSEISSDGKAILSDYGRVIPNGAAVLVKGEANTEYALPSTTDAATYTGENLLVPNTTLRYLPTTESSKTNYYFDGIKFVKATGGETIHEKQAYLSVASESETMPLAILETVSAPTFTIDGSSVTITGGKSSDAGAVMKTYYQIGTTSTAPAITEGTWTEYTESITMPTTGYVYAYSENTVSGLTSEVVSALVIILKQPIVAYKENNDGKAVYTITSADDNDIKYQLGEEEAVDVKGKTAEISVDKKTTLNAWAYYNDEESSKVSVELLTTPIVETDGVFNFTQLNTENVGDTNIKLEVSGDAVLTVDETPLYKPTITTAATFADYD